MSFWSQIEAKVKSATVLSLLASAALAILNAVVGNSALLGSLPPWLQFVIVTVAPAVITFLGGYVASHSAPSLIRYDTNRGQTELAKRNYAAYTRARNGQTHDGKPMPTWDDLGDVQHGWTAGAVGVLEAIRRNV